MFEQGLWEGGVSKFAGRLSVLLLIAVLVPALAFAGSKSVKKESGETKLVDSGSFGIFRNGQRIATETFRVQQNSEYSITTSDLKLQDGTEQSSELQLWPNGDLRKYSWRSLSPEKVQSVLEPGDQILLQQTSVGTKKPESLPYILPSSTIVLDDYFFIHRELLAWRYLASGCVAGGPQCRLTKAQMGIIVPRQHTPATVSMQFMGREKVTLRGVEQELSRFLLKNDDQEWVLWLNNQHMLVRVLIASENTEVLRD